MRYRFICNCGARGDDVTAPRTPFINTDIATAKTMTPCQVEEYARCITRLGDHDMCTMAAQMSACTD